MQVPVIDLSQSEVAAAAQVRAACLGTGFFYGRGPPNFICSQVERLSYQRCCAFCHILALKPVLSR